MGGGFGRGTVTGTKLAACLASSATTSSAAVCGKAGAESSTKRGVNNAHPALFPHGSDAMFAVSNVQKASMVFMYNTHTRALGAACEAEVSKRGVALALIHRECVVL